MTEPWQIEQIEPCVHEPRGGGCITAALVSLALWLGLAAIVSAALRLFGI